MADTTQTPARQHWQQHACCMNVSDARNGHAPGSVYSTKNEGEAANVLLTSYLGPFSVDFKMTPDRAEELARHLTEAAAAARAADVEFAGVLA